MDKTGMSFKAPATTATIIIIKLLSDYYFCPSYMSFHTDKKIEDIKLLQGRGIFSF
jgi:hypothetical protein